MTSPADALRPAAVVVLAAGEGTRMRSDTPKVLHDLCGRSLLGHVLAAARALRPEHLVVVVGHQREQVAAHVAAVDPDAVTAVQEVRLGTGHAVRCGLEVLPELAGTVVVLGGDTPLVTPAALGTLLTAHTEGGQAASVLCATVPDPSGLGRVLRRPDGLFARIVEERDATPAERAIAEVNSGIYAFDAGLLAKTLDRLTTDNDQGQEYLPDVLGLLSGDGHPVAAVPVADHRDVLGCNDRVQLAELRAILRDRLVAGWMRAGATVVDPATVWVDVEVTLGRDTVIHPNVQLRGRTSVADRAEVGPDSTLVDTRVGADARVLRAHCVGAEIGADCVVGPFAYLRPGSRLGRAAKAGTFVETKNAQLGEGAKVPHLSYVGDATIGDHTNIGAASVFVNYDGVNKHHTTIGSHSRVGSDTMLIGPVTIGDGAYTAAGSVISRDVPPGALGVARAAQRNIEGWVERRRAGTAAAEAAVRAAARAAAERPGQEPTEPTADPDGPAVSSDPAGPTALGEFP